ncbi:MAG: hypothetical protein HC849_04670 [Oscillatoriales cyanobacterium RU_3_3]|nr:hypothetical protein [Oscillatoriales cyanobacterium RU_3_3]
MTREKRCLLVLVVVNSRVTAIECLLPIQFSSCGSSFTPAIALSMQIYVPGRSPSVLNR